MYLLTKNGYSLGFKLILCAAFLAGTPAFAQSVSVTASVNENTIGTEERLTYTVEVQGKTLPQIESPSPPSTTGLTLISTYPSTSRNISIVNGEMTQSIGYSWSYLPVQEGTATISAASITVGDETFETEPLTITVVPQSQRPVRRRQSNPLTDPFGMFDQDLDDTPPPEISDKDIFIETRPNKRRVYQNEPVTIEYELYFRSGIQLRQSRLADSWDAEGFWREDLDVEARPVPRTVVRNGIRYNMIVLKRVVVFPTRTGELTVDPLKIESEASVPLSARETFFSMRNRYVPVVLNSPAVKLDVSPLPSGAPDTFTGAVGRFSLDAFVDKSELEVGESLTLKASISGEGNIATLEQPSVTLPGIFERYDPQVESNIRRTGNVIRGTKDFEYILVPRSNGTFEIPPVTFTYFDPSARAYKTEKAGETTVTVTGTSIPFESVAIETGSGFPVDDVAPILTSTERWQRISSGVLHKSAYPYLLLLLPIGLLAAGYLIKKQTDRIAGDVVYARNRRANPLAKLHLKNASEKLAAGDSNGYYEALEKAVTGFVGDRLNIGEKALTRDDLTAILERHSVPQSTRTDLKTLLAECDMAQFSPVAPDREAMSLAHDRASHIIQELEDAFLAHEAKEEVAV